MATSKEDLLYKEDLKDKNTYILGAKELQEPRNLEDSEKEMIARRRAVGWTFGNPISDMTLGSDKKKDATQFIQSPYVRTGVDVAKHFLSSGISGMATGPILLKAIRPSAKLTGKAALGAGLVMSALQAAPVVMEAHTAVEQQKLINDIVEHFIKNHPKGQVTTLKDIFKVSLNPQKKTTNLKSKKASTYADVAEIMAQSPLLQVYSAAAAAANLGAAWYGKKQKAQFTGDLRERFEAKKKAKQEEHGPQFDPDLNDVISF